MNAVTVRSVRAGVQWRNVAPLYAIGVSLRARYHVIHIAQVLAAGMLVVILLRVRTLTPACGALLAIAMLFGSHTLAGTIYDARRGRSAGSRSRASCRNARSVRFTIARPDGEPRDPINDEFKAA